jgi:hypothetical protein
MSFWTDANDPGIPEDAFDAYPVAHDLHQHPLSRASNPSDQDGAAGDAAGIIEIEDFLRTRSAVAGPIQSALAAARSQ